MFKLSQRSIDNLMGVHPRLVILMGVAIQDSPVDFTITDGVRTVARQQALYAQGRTAPGNIVTQCDGITNKSPHQPKADGKGYAVDLYPFVNGSVQLNDAVNLRRIAEHIKATAQRLGYSIEWGGDWKSFVDMPHFELKK
jgi:peptidoglycan L-alanyl-D-glutamate endopeptidase CwlK